MRKIIYLILGAMMSLLLLCGCSDKTEPNVTDTIRNAPIAKLETPDGRIVYVDSEIAVLKSFADLEIHTAPLEPSDTEDDWLYMITFNPSEKVSESNEIVVAFHDTYVQINNEFYSANEGVQYDSIIDWAKAKFDYFFQ